MNSNIVLTSKLITIDHGQYIVKVKAQQENKTIGSALASAYSVEEAEDKARQRVLKLINQTIITSSPPQSPNNPSPTVNVSPSKPQIPKNIPTPDKEILTPPPAVTPEKQGKISPPPQAELNPIPALDNNPPITETIASDNQTIEPEETLPNSTELPLSYQEEEKPEEVEVISPPNNKFDLTDAVDFSQVIDQTTIELKRLGWTQEEGKKYLLETYGKKSRHLLSDEELIEFLTYLQTQ
ncbi:hypothetical protein A5482_008830 [Cyanobacterium sp. IPPAS B-1200]|uniref:hypothetical protein n=1 Tax=Cyanobacterium sp. IPPAS B-1200 TaxID=1562720 RepID=UPI0008525756|nr:hypothetical protein [Cyanobacterium sp. IPPAS B-1200]OEJ77401.1 hypothetical protein A5482_05760 [Cyanobacterium sp. IPPAS B-1200]